MSLVFVVIPAYNAEHFLDDCLTSLLNQTFTDWQTAVIDDGSTDGTFAVAERYARQDARILTETFPNGGVAAARNRGLDRMPADAEYVLFLDNDDFLAPNALETLVGRLAAHPAAVAAYGLARPVDQKSQSLSEDLSKAYGAVRHMVCGRKLVLVPEDAPTTFASLVI